MEKIRAVIIDDELSSRKALKNLLKAFFKEVEIVGMAATIADGLEQIRESSPELVFLDIQLENESGFDLFTDEEQFAFEVVFVTAHEEYALKAFKFSAADYLVKPVKVEDLQRALDRVNKIRSQEEGVRDVIKKIDKILPPTSSERFTISDNKEIRVFEVSQIRYCKASRSYCEVFFSDGKMEIVSKSLIELQSDLNNESFVRIHKSYLINLAYLKSYIRGRGGEVQLDNGICLPVSREKKAELLSKIES